MHQNMKRKITCSLIFAFFVLLLTGFVTAYCLESEPTIICVNPDTGLPLNPDGSVYYCEAPIGNGIYDTISSVEFLANESVTDVRIPAVIKSKVPPYSPLDLIDLNINWAEDAECDSQAPQFIDVNVTIIDANGKEDSRFGDALSGPAISSSSTMIHLTGFGGEVSEDLIRTIDKQGYVKITLTPRLDQEHKDLAKPFTLKVPMTNCAHIEGDGKKIVVGMRDASSELSSAGILDKSRSIYEAYNSVDPFSKYINNFSFYADLKNYTEGSVLDFMADMDSSSCKALTYIGFMAQEKLGTAEGGSVMGINRAVISSTVSSGFNRVLLHEVGHAFAGLGEEYLIPIFVNPVPNCTDKHPEIAFKYNDVLYGDNGPSGCGSATGNYKPSINSIMNNLPNSSYYNVLSCGVIISKISDGGVLGKYWQECMQLATVKPNCTVFSCPTGFSCNLSDKLCHFG